MAITLLLSHMHACPGSMRHVFPIRRVVLLSPVVTGEPESSGRVKWLVVWEVVDKYQGQS